MNYILKHFWFMGSGQVLSPQANPLVSLGARLLLLLVCLGASFERCPSWTRACHGEAGTASCPLLRVCTCAFTHLFWSLRSVVITALHCSTGPLVGTPVLVSMVPTTGKHDFVIRTLWYCCRGRKVSVLSHIIFRALFTSAVPREWWTHHCTWAHVS